MPEITLRPRSATELVDAAFQVYRRDPMQFIVGLALIYVPWLLIASTVGVTAAARTGQLPQTSSLFISLLGSWLVYTLSAGVTTVMADDVYFGRTADVTKAYISVGRHLVALMISNLIAAILIFFGLVFLILPGLYAFSRVFAISQVVMLENGGVGAAFSRSSFLSKGNKRHVINAMGLVFLLNLAISLGVNFVAAAIPSVTIKLVVGTAVSVLIAPLIGIVATLLYYDVRIRREGFDIEYLAAAAGPPAESPAT